MGSHPISGDQGPSWMGNALPTSESAALHSSWAAVPYPVKKDRHSSHSVIVALLGEGKGQRLLDVGAAQGDMAQVLTTHGYEVTALEGDPTLAEMARRKCHKVIVADLDYSLPNLEGPFDVVLCADVLEHLKNPLRVLVDLRQQLKPEGVAVVSVPNAVHLWVRLQLCLGRFDYAERGVLDRTHLRFFTLSSFRRLLREAGLTVLKLTTTPAPLPLVVPERYHGRMLDTVHGMSAFVARRWKTMFAYQFVALTRKGAAQ